ncbi:uncharacterized protein PHACADRAFT_186985 [Phanerochaete carnosa HHB-10118-sp]|uniref:Tcp11-domain-containing protein n=1 Tax=Phanerochaete carnosa (strain HHB-10118-sp) TaxID=650164 RepID=K5VY53_PHACS|nr:uncharacterized protein PHACADRAFT_186985 [Phanerochaete carnosa HHB-10118-sp]EKM51529.1 hypothetical protein PHACADRAFT_186985 [Phanerochaete carnosa HHB-10118-sp]
MAACVARTACHHALGPRRPKYGRPCLFFPTAISLLALSRRPMDDCPHESARFLPLTRKRKAAADTANTDPAPPDSLLMSPDATPRIPTEPADVSKASWLLEQHATAVIPSWQEPPSGSSPAFAMHTRQDGPSKPKRPRIEIPQTIPTSPRKSRSRRLLYSSNVSSPRKPSRLLRPTFVRDTGVVSAVELGHRVPPLHTGGLAPLPSPLRSTVSLPVTPIEPSYAQVPSHQPPINRETLKELDLDAILRNPQLRHDLLFDPGLQFRPTFSRRKRDLAESYWIAVVRELDTGCTCTTLDLQGKLIERRCICGTIPLPAEKPIRAYSSAGNFVTVRSPSRLRPLLAELLEVLISIIRPVVLRPTGLSLQANVVSSQEQNDSHVAYLRSILDADLIQQEIEHGVFDPSGVFKAIGDIMRCYCAPMRDQAVNQMVALAESCSPGGTGTKVDAVRAIRLCFEILELMKLDVANHQLQTLRPYLVRSAAQFELKMFQENRQKGPLPLEATRQWLQTAFDDLAAQTTDPRSSSNLSASYSRYPRFLQIQLSVVRAVINLIFDSASLPSPPSSPLPSSIASSPLVSSPTRQGYPETLYLDHIRLTTLRNDAADFTTLYMLMMLYRQLVHSGSTPAGPKIAVSSDDLAALKKEIWEIGPARLGYCFTCRPASGIADSESELAAWRKDMDDVVLQLTTKACEARARSRSSTASPSPASSIAPVQRPIPSSAPDSHLLKLATSWTDSHLRSDSPLGALMKKRVKEAVEDLAISIVLPSLASSTKPDAPSVQEAARVASGLEPLLPEVRHLAQKLSKLVSIHLNVYGTLYTQSGFVQDRTMPGASSLSES